MLQTLKGLIGLPILAGIIYFGAQSLTAKVEADLAENAGRALSGIRDEIFNVNAQASGRDVTVEGFAVSQAGRDRAMTAVSGLPGVGRAIDATRLLETRKPFVLGLQRQGPRVVITGSAPPGQFRDQVGQALAKLGLEVEDRTEWANGAPKAFASLAVFASSQDRGARSGRRKALGRDPVAARRSSTGRRLRETSGRCGLPACRRQDC